jgi:hypothetical protein
MPFGNITAQTITYEPRSPGIYTRSSVTFGQPDNSFVVRGAPKGDPLRASVSRVLQKDVTIGGQTVRKTATVTLSIVTPSSDFTATELDSLASDISEFITSATASRLLQGES